MKKFIKNTANSIRTKAIRLAATRRSGEGYIDTAVKILIAVVLGALLLAGLYALFGDVVMPTLNQRIKDIRSPRSRRLSPSWWMTRRRGL